MLTDLCGYTVLCANPLQISQLKHPCNKVGTTNSQLQNLTMSKKAITFLQKYCNELLRKFQMVGGGHGILQSKRTSIKH